MKRGAPKTIDEYLEQVNGGYYAEFKQFLIELNKPLLKIRTIPPYVINFSHLIYAIKDTPVKELDLSYNGIELNSAEQIVLKLQENHAITSLNLSGNKIGFGDIKKFADPLKNTGVTHLNLSQNKFGFMWVCDLIQTLKGSKVTHLYIANINLTPYILEQLAVTLPGSDLVHINLSQNGIFFDSNFDAFTNIIPQTKLKSITTGFKDKYSPKLPLLSKALDLNYQKTVCLTPFYAIYFNYLPEESKKQLLIKENLRLNKKPSIEEEIKYGFGIFWNLTKDLQNHILTGYFPQMRMSADKVKINQGLAKEYYNKKGQNVDVGNTSKHVLLLKK